MSGTVRYLVESGKQRDREERGWWWWCEFQSGLEKRATQSSWPEISMF